MPASKLSAMSDEDLEALLDEGADEDEAAPKEGKPDEDGSSDDAPRRVDLSMPAWMVEELDAVARHLAVPRQAVVNMWLAERLAQERQRR